MAEILDKVYDPQKIEAKWYDYWEKSGLFRARADGAKTPYCIVIPPPNVTGSLHMGHALNNTLQDILIRYKRMKGYDALWMPGMDHAGHRHPERGGAHAGRGRRQPPQIWAGRPSSTGSGNGRRNPAATSSTSSNAWAAPATGAGSASPWTRASPGRSGRSSSASMKKA